MKEVSILELSARMARGETTSVSITEDYIRRIENIDQSGPRINSVIELNPDAIAIGEERNNERAAGRVRGPLYGIPILLKDNIGTRDRMTPTAGSLALII
jgi:amidase